MEFSLALPMEFIIALRNLKDTYAYFKQEEERSKIICKEREAPVPPYQGEHSPFKVSQRSLAVYQGLIKKREGAVI